MSFAAPPVILAVFAHPDDEIGVGSTLAHYSDAGVHVVLACASRGEAATIFCDSCATRENLAEVRTHELECACQHLGIAELRWLDWPDGGIAALDRQRAIAQVVTIIREVHPTVIITHPENGIYPHPDHVAVWEIVRAAYEAAGDRDQFMEAGEAWKPTRLFTRAMPQSYFDAAPAFATYRVQLNGQQLPFYATPDDQIDVTMQVAPWAERRWAAWDCHRSQHNPEGAFAQVPDAVRRAMAEQEHFVLASSRSTPPPEAKSDLLAGLVPEVTETEAAQLRGELAVQRAWLVLAEEAGRHDNAGEFRTLIPGLIDRQQEMLYLLARALRTVDIATGGLAAAPAVLQDGGRRRNTRTRLAYLLTLMRASGLRFHRLAAQTAMGAEELWRELVAVAQAQSAEIETALLHS